MNGTLTITATLSQIRHGNKNNDRVTPHSPELPK